MRISINSLMILTTVIVFLSCGGSDIKISDKPNEDSTASNKKPQAIVFDKLIGTWKNKDEKSFERWTKNENGMYRSVGFRVKEKDTTYTEEIMAYNENGKWISENKAFGQNKGKAVKFTQSLLTDSSVQFSNPGHDFPTDIHYTVVDANRVNAFIVGPNDKRGKDTIHFNFTRVNE